MMDWRSLDARRVDLENKLSEFINLLTSEVSRVSQESERSATSLREAFKHREIERETNNKIQECDARIKNLVSAAYHGAHQSQTKINMIRERRTQRVALPAELVSHRPIPFL